MNPGFTAETSAQIAANQITAPEFHSYRCKHCSPGEKASCRPDDLSQKCISHVRIQVFGCVKDLEAINNTR